MRFVMWLAFAVIGWVALSFVWAFFSAFQHKFGTDGLLVFVGLLVYFPTGWWVASR